MSKRAFQFACLLSLTLAASAGVGAEPERSQAAPGASQAESAPTPPQDGTSDRPGNSPGEIPAPRSAEPASPEVFVPSEEISEDFTIPYPVDI